MELKDFVADTLTQIAEGILEAQRRAGSRYRISPRHVRPATDTTTHFEYEGDSLERIDFDVLVSTKMAAAGEGKAKLFVVDGALQTNLNRENANRIKFPIYVQWPRHE